ncbi:alpha/beta hydrolase family protein [Caldimonas sp. KR1-144]|uniref:alpha/beta hydrolase family protein n=1 Tax=Caldimonas sp. KR1-144 TaxID=3400911 RepID=UPI003C0A66B6
MKFQGSRGLAAALTALALAACGGSDDDAPPARGTVVTGQLAGHATRAQIDAGTATSGLQPLSGLAACDVDVRYVLYVTRDAQGQPQTASAGVLVPSGTDAACTGDRPVVLYAHGTTTTKSKNMADVVNDNEAKLVMAMYAAQGFIVVAPNYLGYDQSSLNYHPYLDAETQAGDMIDGLRAAKAHLAAASTVKPSAKLLITGYSQGGHVAMATHKVIERDHASEFTVSASGPMSGPYNLVSFNDIVTGPGPINGGATIFAPLLLTSYQRAYGNIYAAPSDVYQSPYDTTAPTLFPTDTPVSQLLAENKLPQDPTFTLLFGTGGLLKDSFRAGYATSNFRAALKTNTLAGTDGPGGSAIGWKPAHPVALCGGAQDPTVYWSINAPVAQGVFAAQGVAVPAFDLETRASLPAGAVGDAIYGGFQQSKAAAGTNAQAQYHGTLVPPFCSALVRGFFQQVLAAGG